MAAPINYNPNTPLITTPFADWQTSFQENFQQMYNAFQINHIALDAANAGNHTYVQLYEQEEPQQTNLGDFSVYTKDVEGQTDQVFMRYSGNGTEFQFTNYQIYRLDPIKSGSTVIQNQYFTFLPGKILVYFGDIRATNDHILKLNPPVAKNIITVNLTPNTTTNNNAVPAVAPFAFEDGIYRDIILSAAGLPSQSINHFYIVLANI